MRCCTRAVSLWRVLPPHSLDGNGSTQCDGTPACGRFFPQRIIMNENNYRRAPHAARSAAATLRVAVPRRYQIAFLVLLCVAVGGAASSSLESSDGGGDGGGREACEEVYKRCVGHMGCGTALRDYMMHCVALMYGETRAEACSDACLQALVSVIGTNDGHAFTTCDCRGNAYCSAQRARVSVCSKAVKRALSVAYDRRPAISCTLAEATCAADTTCRAALDYFWRHCAALLRGERCTPACQHGLRILQRQANAQQLRTCFCEGTEDYGCAALRSDTQRLCYELTDARSATSRLSAAARLPLIAIVVLCPLMFRR